MISALEKRPFSKTLDGNRICLVSVSPRFTTAIWEYLQRDRALGGRNYRWVQSEEDVAHYISKEPESDAREIDYLILFEGRVVGSFHVHTVSYLDHKAEIGYALEKGEEGKGFASEALGLVECEMKRLGFNKLIISCNSNNSRSIKVAERNGFHREGLLIQDCIENGEFRDSLVFGKLLRGPRR
jgi:hypothetical protein